MKNGIEVTDTHPHCWAQRTAADIFEKSEITELTPEIMHELIKKNVIHAPDKSSGHRK